MESEDVGFEHLWIGSLWISQIGCHFESFFEIHGYIKQLWYPHNFCIFDFQPLWPFDFSLDQICLFLDMSFRGDMLILGYLWIFVIIHFFFGIQCASIGHGMGA